MSAGFIGAGWAFPLRTDAGGGFALVAGEREIEESISSHAAVAEGAGIGVADAVLLKPGKLTFEELAHVKHHAEIGAAIPALSPLGIDVLGINCATGPVEMSEPLRQLSESAGLPLSCLPNAGLPSVVNGHMHYDLSPEQLAEHHAKFVTEYGIAAVGGCCGTTPAHIRAIAEELGLTRERVRQIQVEALERLRAGLLRRGVSKEVLL